MDPVTGGPVGRLLSAVFECDDPGPADRARRVSFQRVDDHEPPTWPEWDRPQRAHTDVPVEDLDAADL